jgi:transglutaminase-like putative cysteine protease
VAALGWGISLISVKDILEAMRRHDPDENQVAVSLGLEAAREPIKPVSSSGFSTLRPAGLPNNHLLGSGPELSSDVFFTVRTGELPPIPVTNVIQIVPRHYWRSYTFDVYTGSGWVSSRTDNVISYSDGQVLYDIPPGYRVLQQDFKLQHGNEGSLYWSGILYSSNLPFEAAWRIPPGQNYPRAVDPFQGADLYGALNSSATYQVESLVRDVSVEQLRSAGRDVPDFIQQRYTNLPSTIPERVYALARDLTSAEATPFDEAMAIQTYLRANYPYSLDVPIPPIGADVVDTFLFEMKKGYCDYYATAMVVMARSVGIPARLVTGFATGSYNAPTAEYIVTAADAHSWVEIYFPGIGWVEFEPTASQPEIVRPQQTIDTPQSVLKAEPQWNKIVRSLYSVPVTARWVFFALAGLLSVLAAFFVLENWFLGMLNPKLALRWMYRSIYRQGRRLADVPVPGQTTYEFVERLQKALNLPDARLDVLTEIYLQGMFGSQPIEKKQVQLAIRAWRGLRWNLLWARKKKLARQQKKS